MKLQKVVWTSKPGGGVLVAEHISVWWGVGGCNRSWLHRAKTPNHHVQCSPGFWPICLFIGWLWFVFFSPLCSVCTYVCTSAHTHACVYGSQSRMLVCSSRQSLSLSPELPAVCLGWLASRPQQSFLVTTPNRHIYPAVYMSAGIWTQVLVLMKQTLTHWDISPAPWLVSLMIKKNFLINLLGFHPVYFDRASPNALLSSMPHPN